MNPYVKYGLISGAILAGFGALYYFVLREPLANLGKTSASAESASGYAESIMGVIAGGTQSATGKAVAGAAGSTLNVASQAIDVYNKLSRYG